MNSLWSADLTADYAWHRFGLAVMMHRDRGTELHLQLGPFAVTLSAGSFPRRMTKEVFDTLYTDAYFDAMENEDSRL